MSDDIRVLLRRLRRQGFTVRVGGSGHHRVTSPAGDTITIAATPRSSALHQVRRDLRRIGARL